PRGVPVATVAVGNAANAGLLAARIIGVSDPKIRGQLDDYRGQLERQARAKGEKVRRASD
ncbi:MAG: 5-(carboxyamino)imidazole ribonucleotide mutase, partial [Gammaproteobacteria bacterium]|nr:5-(carboxyamino)imidazole ribonucleotide mutase [Gammaproteobacteria bacterium]